MQSPYFLTDTRCIVSHGSSIGILILRDKKSLTREDRFILEKHSQDMLRILIKRIINIEAAEQLSHSEKASIRRLLDEYLETNELLSRD